MTTARTWAVAMTGVDGHLVEVEADLSNQTPEFKIIGLPDKSLGEAVQRVHNACKNSGLDLPRRRFTVNLSPASLPKQGSGFDLAIALSALAAAGAVPRRAIAHTVLLGELGLDGRLRPVAGVLPAVFAAVRAGFEDVVVPFANAEEAALVPGVRIRAAASLAEVASSFGAEVEVPGPWLRQTARRVSADARRSLDRALERGALTLRGYDRVLRLAWTMADLGGVDAPGTDEVGRALFLKKGLGA